ncbi:MAG: hypothetical protein R2761_04275 [Acidimicrobiales bacterium]
MVERDRGITPADIEAKFREIQGQFGEAAEGGKRTLVMVGAAGAVVLILAVYVMGRRAGRKRSTVLEIRRI